MRERARQRKAEELMTYTLRRFEEDEGIPVVLFDAYADAAERYELTAWRPDEEVPTVGEVIAETRIRYEALVSAIGAFALKGGRDQWDTFVKALAGFVAAAGLAVALSARALRESDVGFSERTDPAFAGLVESEDS
jgi:hypothetical protein